MGRGDQRSGRLIAAANGVCFWDSAPIGAKNDANGREKRCFQWLIATLLVCLVAPRGVVIAASLTQIPTICLVVAVQDILQFGFRQSTGVGEQRFPVAAQNDRKGQSFQPVSQRGTQFNGAGPAYQ